MIVLHVGVGDNNFCLWGETPLKLEDPLGRRLGDRRRKQNAGKSPLPNPYDAGAAGLCSALKESGFRFKAGKSSAESMILWLPTSGIRPVPSSPLISDPPDPGDETVLLPWKVTSLRLSTGQTVEFLCACMGKQTLAPGVIVGKDLAFWAQALRLTASLATRQQFLPGLTEEKGECSARWKPVIHGPDAERFSVLAGAMPAVSRAVRGTGKSMETASDAAAAPSSVSVLSSFIEKVVDHLVRSAGLWLATGGLRGDWKDFESSHDRWLHSLRAGDGAMVGSPAELAELAGQIQEWQRPLATSAASPFRLCFRLEEPDGNGDQKEKAGLRMASWYVRYLLQAARDPSLLIPAEEAWKAKG
ncbi:MAG: Helicase, family, partial [Deltaproteobacteria bacterium]|nr:Helicase, family [Deltaproteobacteria bacterium]